MACNRAKLNLLSTQYMTWNYEINKEIKTKHLELVTPRYSHRAMLYHWWKKEKKNHFPTQLQICNDSNNEGANLQSLQTNSQSH